jgi:16S rRNA (uracil1498-N3)-methyltransferase
MRLHRFYTGKELDLEHHVWLKDERILNQWRKVLRYQAGQQVVLFDGIVHERLYVITELKADAAHLELITDFERKLPQRDIYLFWSLLKKDKNDWVLQKCTELGVNHFVPILAERSEKTGFDVERAEKIVMEAAEQCGRFNIPAVREPLLVQTAINEFAKDLPLYLCEETDSKKSGTAYNHAGVFVGPEGGWTENEKRLFNLQEIPKLGLGDFILRAETASVVASAKLIQ